MRELLNLHSLVPDHNYRVCARRPCWRRKTIKLFSFGTKFNSHAKIFLLFTPPTWPPRTDSICSNVISIISLFSVGMSAFLWQQRLCYGYHLTKFLTYKAEPVKELWIWRSFTSSRKAAKLCLKYIIDFD